jgi:hypothetical protein
VPESVYATTCVSAKRAKEFKTPVGIFSYKRVPEEQFYMCVDRIIYGNNSVIFVAQPWRALADFIYIRRKTWKNLQEIELDLRIDKSSFIESNLDVLNLLVNNYPSSRVRKYLKKYLKEINKNLLGNK